MERIHAGKVALVLAHVVIGGWAFIKLLEPANMLQMLRLFSLC